MAPSPDPHYRPPWWAVGLAPILALIAGFAGMVWAHLAGALVCAAPFSGVYLYFTTALDHGRPHQGGDEAWRRAIIGAGLMLAAAIFFDWARMRLGSDA